MTAGELFRALEDIVYVSIKAIAVFAVLLATADIIFLMFDVFA